MRVHWSLSEFLNLLETRGQCWGTVELGVSDGFRIRPSEHVLFYTMLGGRVAVAGMPGGDVALADGDTLIVIGGGAHAIRTRPDASTRVIDFLENDEYADAPQVARSADIPAARLLCGRIKMRWPNGLDHAVLPPFLRISGSDSIIDFDALMAKAKGTGSAALLTRAAALLITEGLREHPDCTAIFRGTNFRDPISRAIQYMELHPHQYWTIEILASKVGMARSTFAGRFAAEVGKPPIEMLTEFRMRRAAELLAQSDLKIAEIAERTGYRSLSAFSRRFEEHFGQSRRECVADTSVRCACLAVWVADRAATDRGHPFQSAGARRESTAQPRADASRAARRRSIR